MKVSVLLRFFIIGFCVFGNHLPIAAQTQKSFPEGENPDLSVMPGGQRQDGVITYSAEFFSKYQPATALDMIMQIPGFQLDDGESIRGFGAAVGNILINGRRPSSKQVQPSAILIRISASQVQSIDLIRDQSGGIDLLGKSALANVRLYDDAAAAVRWEIFFQHNSLAPIKPGINASLSDRWRAIEYNIGISFDREANGEEGIDRILDGNSNLIEERHDVDNMMGIKLAGVYLNASTWLGQTLWQFNSKFGLRDNTSVLTSSRIPQLIANNPYEVTFNDQEYTPSYEVGIDAENILSADLVGKGIVLFTGNELNMDSFQRIVDSTGLQTLFREADSRTMAKEAIARLEFVWSGLPSHGIQFNLEGAYNTLSGSLTQTDDIGAGPRSVIIPGANSRVEEVRGDFLLKDIWSLGKLELDYGLGGEVSSISQTGDEELERDFFFLKPQGVLSYSSGDGNQARLRLAREVSQLNFNDFVSATAYQDDDLALGNPNLRPDKTWAMDLSYEHRFGRESVVKVTGYHHWINDLVDLLPLSSLFEAPGNIGDARRWGVEFESTVPLGRLGLIGSKLDIKLRWQDSSVIDPVTGESRVLSAAPGFGGPPNIKFREENRYVFDIGYRQDFEVERVAWGWRVAEQAARPLFKVNELDQFNEGVLIDAFIETTRWFGMKMRIDGNNLLHFSEGRNRTIFAGERDLSPVASRILRERFSGRRITLSFSGNF